jgi:hypothetical protein
MSALRDKLKELAAARADYHEKANTLTSPEIGAVTVKCKAIQAEIQEIMTEGAQDCEDGHRPIGIFHDGTANPFEIGDPITRDRRVRAATLEDAVEDWNAGEYLPPREPETVEATHRDATGEIKSQRTLKVKRA